MAQNTVVIYFYDALLWFATEDASTVFGRLDPELSDSSTRMAVTISTVTTIVGLTGLEVELAPAPHVGWFSYLDLHSSNDVLLKQEPQIPLAERFMDRMVGSGAHLPSLGLQPFQLHFRL